MFGIGLPEIIIILVVCLIVFGAGKLPEVGSAIGKSIKEFKKEFNGLKSAIDINEKDEKKSDKA